MRHGRGDPQHESLEDADEPTRLIPQRAVVTKPVATGPRHHHAIHHGQRLQGGADHLAYRGGIGLARFPPLAYSSR